jgi:hypothetical protein
MKFVSDVLTGKDNLSYGQIVKLINGEYAESLLMAG